MDRTRQRQLQRIKEQNQEHCSTNNLSNTALQLQGIGPQSPPITADHNVEIHEENRITYYPPVFV